MTDRNPPQKIVDVRIRIDADYTVHDILASLVADNYDVVSVRDPDTDLVHYPDST